MVRLVVQVLRTLLAEKPLAQLAFETKKMHLLFGLVSHCHDPAFLVDLCVALNETVSHDLSDAENSVRYLSVAFRETLFRDYFGFIYEKALQAIENDPRAEASQFLLQELLLLFRGLLAHYPEEFGLYKVRGRASNPSTECSWN